MNQVEVQKKDKTSNVEELSNKKTLSTLANFFSASENKYEALISNMPDGFMTINEALEVEFCNPKCVELLGLEEGISSPCSYKELISKSRLNIYAEQLNELFVRSATTNETIAEVFILEKDLRVVETAVETLEVRIIPVKNHENQYVQMIFRDLTDKFNMDKFLVQTEKTNALGLVISGISHEINNPLTCISNGIHLLRKINYNEEKRSSVYAMLLENVSRISKIIDELRLFGHLERVDNGEFSVVRGIKDAVDLFSCQYENPNVQLNLELDDEEDLTIQGNRTQFIQLLVNLLLNALKAVDDNGVISVTLSKQNFSTGSSVVVAVEDNGCGIPENEIEQIFDPFFVSKWAWQGSGLGLAISYRIAQLLKGTIKVTSKLGEGSKFIVTIPLKETI